MKTHFAKGVDRCSDGEVPRIRPYGKRRFLLYTIVLTSGIATSMKVIRENSISHLFRTSFVPFVIAKNRHWLVTC